MLGHNDPNSPLKFARDTSAYGICAVISHIMPDESEKSIAFASRTLTKAERNYSLLEKEALSIIFGVKKFHQYLYGWKFTLITDHKPIDYYSQSYKRNTFISHHTTPASVGL